nr:unnamed protein product [Callosobruchus chinensis]CAH7720524.1 unnamed protein product [Callosobruchus chinensis]CAH7728350.1 unnamed protein product [Callosobruchus chinensis]CAH7737141.1 unnamed protein product [Callosobruchus chinensis]CAH7756335.1 unnamed protein product [Callosobruchus chinensis]
MQSREGQFDSLVTRP